jgi:hypothetical protein
MVPVLKAIIDKQQKNITQICFICTIEIDREQPVGKRKFRRGH